MESQPQNPEFRINPENFHPCIGWSVIVAFPGFIHSFLYIFRTKKNLIRR